MIVGPAMKHGVEMVTLKKRQGAKLDVAVENLKIFIG